MCPAVPPTAHGAAHFLTPTRVPCVCRKINCYQSLTRWTNCNGSQLCGTCIVDVIEGVDKCTRRSLDESSTLRENPETYKLAWCVPPPPGCHRACVPHCAWESDGIFLSLHLSCACRVCVCSVSNVYGDITVQLCPKIGAAQWTR